MLQFRLFGVPFQVQPYFWLTACLVSGIGTGGREEEKVIWRLMIWAVCVFISIVVHELGHALVGRRFGATPAVALYGMGGVTFLPGARLTRWRSILVSLAGPAAGFALYGFMRLTLRGMNSHPADMNDPVIFSLVCASVYLLEINLLWTIFNLLPILPLDGGQVLREVLGPRWIGVTRAVGGVAAGALALLCFRGGMFLNAMLLGYLAYMNFRGDTRSLPGAGISR